MALNDSVRTPDRDGEVAEGALAFTVNKEIDLALLGDELREATGWGEEATIAVETSGPNTTAWIIPPEGEDVVVNRIKGIVSRHAVPVAEPEKVEAAAPDFVEMRLDDLRRALDNTQELTDDQLVEAVKLLLIRSGRN